MLEAIEEHHIVKWVLNELEGLPPQAENYDAKVTVLIENVRHHVKEEEKELFPDVRKALGRARLNELGDELAQVEEDGADQAAPALAEHPAGQPRRGAIGQSRRLRSGENTRLTPANAEPMPQANLWADPGTGS